MQFAAAVIGRGFYILLQIVLARHLGTHGYGLYAIGWTVAGLASTFAPLGMPQAVLRFGIGGRAALRSLPMVVTGVASLAIGAAIFLGADIIAVRIFNEPAAGPVIRAFAPTVPLIAFQMLLAATLRASAAMLASAFVGGLLFALYLAATALVFLVAPSAIVAAHMYTLSIAVTLVVAMVLLTRRSVAGVSPAPSVLIRFGVVTMLIHSANVLNLFADRIVIGIMADAETVGIYQVAAQLAAIIIVLRSAVTTVFEASAARLKAGGEAVPDVTRAYFAAARLLLHVAAPGLVVLAVTAGFWIDLLFGPAFSAAAPALTILVAGQLAATCAGPSVTALHMTGRENVAMGLSLGNCALNLAGNVALIPVLGAMGAAVASSIAMVVVALACLLVLCRSGRLAFSLSWLGDILLGIAACTGTSLLLVTMLGRLSIPGAILVLVTAYAAYAAVAYLGCAVEDEIIDPARRAVRRHLRRWAWS